MAKIDRCSRFSWGSIVLAISVMANGNPVAAQQKGSAAAYQAIARAENIAREQAESWRKATKLRVDDSIPIPSEPVQGEQPKDLKEGQVVDQAYWNFEVLDIIGPNQVLLILGNSTVILLDGHPTEGLVTDQSVRLVGPVRVSGTYTYLSQTGQESVRKLKFLSAQEVSEIRKAEEEAEEAKLYREFTDATGNFKFVGKFVDYRSGEVQFIRKEDQKPISVKLSLLSADDRKWIAEEVKARRAKAEQERNQRR